MEPPEGSPQTHMKLSQYMVRITPHGRVCALFAALVISCGESEEPTSDQSGRGPVRYLFEEPMVRIELPESLVQPEVARLLEQPQVWILDEPIEVHTWVADEPRFFDTPQKRWMSNLRYQTAEGRRIVPMEEVAKPKERVEFTRPKVNVVPAGKALFGDGMIRRSLPRADGAPGKMVVSYLAQSDAIKADLASTTSDLKELEPSTKILKQEARRTLTAPVPWSAAWTVDVSQSSRVQLAWGMNRRTLRADGEGVKTTLERSNKVQAKLVARRVDGTEALLAERIIEFQKSDHFHELEVDLSQYDGEELELEVSFSAAGGGEGIHAFLAEPLIDAERVPDVPRHPNVIILLLDTLRADRLGCYGWERAITPNLDALAARGVRFDQNMSAAPWTLPSHVSLFSSLYVSEHGVWDSEVLSEEAVTLAEVARDAGYLTVAFTEGGHAGKEYGFTQGFSVFRTGNRDVRQTYAAAKKWISEARGPFMAFVQTYQVHSPYNPPDEWREKLVRPYSGELAKSVKPGDHRWGRNAPGTRLGPEDETYLQDLYDAEIAYVDEAVGQLIEWLTEEGLMEDTAIVVTADHGEEFGDHGLYGHGWSLYEEQLRVPLIVYAKGLYEGGHVAMHPVHSVDMAPTVAKILGIPVPDTWSGEVLSIEGGARERPLFTPYFTRAKRELATAFRMGDYKFIVFPPDGRPADDHPEKLLFDLSKDPLEQNNLFDPNDPDSDRWMQSVGEPWEKYPMRYHSESAAVNSALLKELEALGYVGD